MRVQLLLCSLSGFSMQTGAVDAAPSNSSVWADFQAKPRAVADGSAGGRSGPD